MSDPEIFRVMQPELNKIHSENSPRNFVENNTTSGAANTPSPWFAAMGSTGAPPRKISDLGQSAAAAKASADTMVRLDRSFSCSPRHQPHFELCVFQLSVLAMM